METGGSTECLCPKCLTQQLVVKIDELTSSLSLQQLLNIAAQYRDKPDLQQHIDYDLENGNMVFTRWYHLKRGSCCGNGCRHCPYSEQVK